MKQEITIDIQNGTCDISITNFPLGRIANLSTISKDVAENLKSALILLGADSKKADEGINLLLQETRDIEYILKGCFSASQSPHI